jgi:hypothetical protein
MRRAIPFVVCLAVLVALAAVALGQVGGTPGARAAAISASGSFEISNSSGGLPVFAAKGIAPGGAATGTVEIEDAGSEPAALTLSRGELSDEPGIGGGELSARLQLTVVDVTEPAAPRTVYSGPLDSMPDQHAGDLSADEARTYEFTATLPDSGTPSSQNAVQGASTTVAYSWTASEVEEGEEEARPGGAENRGTPSPPAEGGGETNKGGVAAEGAALDLIVPKIKGRVRAGRLVAIADCDKSCRLSVRGRFRATGGGRRRRAKVRFRQTPLLAPGPHRVRIPIPAGLRRWLLDTQGRERLRAKLRFLAVGTDGERDVVRKRIRLRVIPATARASRANANRR